jgi:hypothetical protein
MRPSSALAAVPLIAALTPDLGPTTGGNPVVISGSGLAGAKRVVFGGRAAVGFTVVSPVEIRATAPAHAPGTVDVEVYGAAARSSVSVGDRYTYGR